MKTTEEKVSFLQNEFPELLRQLDPATPPLFGKMSVQQMIEHFSDSLRIANGRDLYNSMLPQDQIEKMQSFLRSDKPFRENTTNRLMSETPPPHRWPSAADAIGELVAEVAALIDVYAQDKDKLITNPFFGDLNYEDQIQLLYKHALHHLRQFGVVPKDKETSLL